MHVVQFSLRTKFSSHMHAPFPFLSVGAVCMRAKLCPLDLKLSQFETVFMCQWYFFSFASQMSVLRLQESPSFFPSHHTLLILCQLAKSTLPFSFLPFKYTASSKFLKANKSHGLCKSPSWRLSPVYQLRTLWAHHRSGRRSFWIRSNLQNTEVRHTKADLSEMLCQQDFPLNYFLCTGYW